MKPSTTVVGQLVAGLAAIALAGACPTFAAWPVSPIDGQHPVRGGFLDPRWSPKMGKWIYHPGIDVAVREDMPTSAPRGFVRRVFAIARGKVVRTTVTGGHRCGRVRIGRVTYGHIGRLQVSVGDFARAGRWIASSCRGAWHVHITEFDRFNTKVNPFRPGGILRPRTDTAAPEIRQVRVVDGELHARIEDPQSFRGWFDAFPRLYNDLPPYRVALDGTTIWIFAYVPAVPFDEVYAPGTYRNKPASTCVATTGPCGGQHWYRLGAAVAGAHLLEAWDAHGNRGTLEIVVE
jgi:hypothetical protein